MSFYDLPKEKRKELAVEIQQNIFSDFSRGTIKYIQKTFSDNDTYIRKTAYIAVGRIYEAEKKLQKNILVVLQNLLPAKDFRVRQSAINAAGEIGKANFEKIEIIMEKGLFDEHHAPRNAVIGSLKKMGGKNPKPVLKFAARYIHHPDKEIRREICHGLELRGRTHPEEILSLLQELEFDSAARVKNTLVHVIGQISYREGCLPVVIKHLKKWRNKEIVERAIVEIINVHDRYKNFAAMTQQEAVTYIKKISKTFMQTNEQSY